MMVTVVENTFNVVSSQKHPLFCLMGIVGLSSPLRS